jgi:hypothetical protein
MDDSISHESERWRTLYFTYTGLLPGLLLPLVRSMASKCG